MAPVDKVVLIAENEWQRRRIAELETWQQKMIDALMDMNFAAAVRLVMAELKRRETDR